MPTWNKIVPTFIDSILGSWLGLSFRMGYGEHVHVLVFTPLKSVAWVGMGNMRSTGLTDGEDIVQHSDWYTKSSRRHCKSLW